MFSVLFSSDVRSYEFQIESLRSEIDRCNHQRDELKNNINNLKKMMLLMKSRKGITLKACFLGC